MTRALFSLSVVFLFLGAGCEDPLEDGAEIPVSPIQGPDNLQDPLPSDSATGGFEVGEDQEDQVREFEDQLRLRIPPHWTDAELSAMQRSVLLAKFQVPAVHPDIEITVSSAGGGIDSNFTRWQGQFSGGSKDVDTIDFQGSTARVLVLSGEFHPGFGRPDRTDWTMMGAAISANPSDFYVKLTGPTDKVKEVEADFRQMIKTAELLR